MAFQVLGKGLAMRGIWWRREAADDDENDRINDHAAEADVEEGLELGCHPIQSWLA
ncbi:hypothetical protein N9A88_03440 [Akkermansiaceae bacterium]|nr:hypothetical protein [Akkermansiaceae bacterium]